MKRVGVGGIVSGKGLTSVPPSVLSRSLDAQPETREAVWAKAQRIDELQSELQVREHDLELLRSYDERARRTQTGLRRLVAKAQGERRVVVESFLEEMMSEAVELVEKYRQTPKQFAGDKNRAMKCLVKLHRNGGLRGEELQAAIDVVEIIEKSFRESLTYAELKAQRDALSIDLTDTLLLELMTERVIQVLVETHEVVASASDQTREILTRTDIGLGEKIIQVQELQERMIANVRQPRSLTQVIGSLYLDERFLMEAAVQLWEKTYKVLGDNIDWPKYETILQTYFEKNVPDVGDSPETLKQVLATGKFLAAWAHVAFPRIMASHTYAAALMCTSVSNDVLEDLELQWKAFEINIPDGILIHNEKDFNRIRILVNEERACLWLYAKNQKQLIDLFITEDESLSEILCAPCGPKSEDRVMFMARRYAAGLLLAMQHTDNFKTRTVSGKRTPGEKRRPPDHRVVFVGSPIKIDARPTVAKFLASNIRRGKPAPPSVQMLVRGHYKRQVVGVGRLGRKVIWVHPYWKGPEDAPILTRPKKLGTG